MDMESALHTMLCQNGETLSNDESSTPWLEPTALKSYLEGLNPVMLDAFIDEICNPDTPASLSEEDTFHVLEVIARVHGSNRVPHIGVMVSAVINIMSFGQGSDTQSDRCSNAVQAMARYGINPLALDEEKASIIRSLSHPLADCLMSKHGNTSLGSAVCLMNLVESSHWRFAPDDAANEVCLKVTGVIEEIPRQTGCHLRLVVSLAKESPLILDPYGRSLLRSGLKILSGTDPGCGNQVWLPCIQMIDTLMRNLDLRTVSPEIGEVLDVLEKYQAEFTPYVGASILDALETAKVIASNCRHRNEQHLSPFSGLNSFACHGRAVSFGSSDNPSTRASQLARSHAASFTAGHDNLRSRSPGQCSCSWSGTTRLVDSHADSSDETSLTRRNLQHSFGSSAHLQYEEPEQRCGGPKQNSAGAGLSPPGQAEPNNVSESEMPRTRVLAWIIGKKGRMVLVLAFVVLAALVAIVLKTLWTEGDDEVFTMVPT